MLLTWSLNQYLILTRKTPATSKKFGDEVKPESYDFIVVFPIYGQFRVISKPGFGGIVFKVYIYIKSDLLSYKDWKQNKEITALIVLLFLFII